MSTLKEQVLEPNIRYINSDGTVLFINADESWSVGTNTNALIKVQFATNTSITDETFNFSAVAIESASNGGFRLFVQSDDDQSEIIEVSVSKSGQVDPESVHMLTRDEMFLAETYMNTDFDESGGVGSGPQLIEGGAVNLYMSADGIYQLGTDPTQLKNITVSGLPLTDKLLPTGWSIFEAVLSANGFEVFVQTLDGDMLDAQLNSNGEYIGGAPLTAEQLANKELILGVDINGNNDLPSPSGWTSVLKDATIKAAVDTSLGVNGKISHTQLVTLMDGIIQSHHTNGNAPISANEFSDLQAISNRGATLFGGDANTVDYLTYAFSKLVNGSPANEFYTGGKTSATLLGNLAANTTIANFEKLVDKWLLGGDLPTPTAGGDTATGKASQTTAVYAKSNGTIFVDGVTSADVKQGALGDCYFVAALVTVADVKPNAISSNVVDNGIINGSHTWGIRFFDDTGKANWVTVNDMLPVSEANSTSLVFGCNPTNNLNGEIWVPLFEKAYAEANMLHILPRGEKKGLDAYWAIEGGFGDTLAEILGGGKVNAYNYNNYNWSENPYVINNVIDRNDPTALTGLQDTLVKAMHDGKPIWIGSGVDTTDAFGNTLLVNGHAFSIQDANKVDLTSVIGNVYNPWGVKALPSPPENVGHLSPFPYTVAELIAKPELDFWIWG